MSLPFLDAQIDDAIARGMESTPTVPGRLKVYSSTGELSQNFTTSLPIHRFNLSHGIKTVAQFQAIIDLWYVVNFGSAGPYCGFLLKDWRDYKLTQSNSRLTAVASTWRINRVHSYGGAEFVRPIYKPTAGVVIKRTRSAVVTTATATVDPTTGLVTITGHTGGDTYTAEGTYCLPVTFSDDQWSAKIDGSVVNLVAVTGDINLEEIRLPA